MKHAAIAIVVVIFTAAAGPASAAEVFAGTNLFAPLRSTDTYLMDNDGTIVHTWTSAYRPGLSVYLLDDGSLLRTGDTGDATFAAGGAGGRIERLDADSNVLWAWEYSTAEHRQHHDVEVLPDGNILVVAWELKTEAEAIAAGRDPSQIHEGELWVDSIIEVAPSGTDGGTVVWEWHVWDHLVQDHDPSRDNYGVVRDHPELVDLNWVPRPTADWTHVNSVDYDPDLDQVLLSVHAFSEVWVIDHGTTTAEAAGHSGGARGHGGDLLYRWGNPQTHDAGTASDQQLFSQHDAEWIEDGLPGAGDILIFNNGLGRPDGSYSTVVEIVPPLLADGSYEAAVPASPDAPAWTYEASPKSSFFADRISGSQRLANGNTLICDGPAGRFFEVTSDGETVWEYEHGAQVFRVERLATAATTTSYWVEIAAHTEGQDGSQWRTDLAVRNASTSEAQVTLVLYSDQQHTLTTTIAGEHQAVFEDVVDAMGAAGKGALEIRSDQPLAAVARIYNQTSKGGLGQFMDAHPAGDGLDTGDGAWLLGLRQLDGAFRTNISVTNTGASTATVTVELYAADGTLLASYPLIISPTEVVQDPEPFLNRAGRSSLGWGFARVSVDSGSGVLSSASVIDAGTGDATTIPMKR